MEKQQQVKLLGVWSSPFVRRVEWALKLKGIEYEYIEEDLANKSPLLLESNPVYKKVPVLIHGEKTICDSLNILEYIDQVWPQNRLLSQDPYEKALLLFWGKTFDEKLIEGMRKVLLAGGEEEEKEVLQQVEETLEILEGKAKGITKFFGGETVGYLDLVLGWIVIWSQVLEEASSGRNIFNFNQCPSFQKWIHEMRGAPLIKENLPSKDRLLAYVQNARKVILDSKARN